MKRYLTTLALALLCVSGVWGQGRTVIAGLEDNAEYRDLTSREEALAHRSDSISRSMNELRMALRTDTLSRRASSEAILRMERSSFEIRDSMARLSSRINAIEQEWILGNMRAGTGNGGDGTTTGAVIGAPQRHSANLVYSSLFDDGLDAAELGELRRAQRSESDLPRLVATYRDNHSLMRSLAGEYDRAAEETTADSIRSRLDALMLENDELDEAIDSRWETIFDVKGYAYNYLMDKSNSADMLELYEHGMDQLRVEQARWAGVGASDAVVNYLLQKRMLTDYEMALARRMGNAAATDSLQRVLSSLESPDKLEDFEPVVLKDRIFFDYGDVSIGGSPYGAANPIPEVRIFPKGIVYRVLVGSFSTPQSPSIFRQAHPMAVQNGDDGRFRYFAGGFPSDSTANEAVEKMRRAGFRNPSVVVWMDGTYMDPKAEADGDEKSFYGVELTGVEELPSEVRDIAASSGGIVRSDGKFIVTPLDAAAAIRLRSALEGHGSGVEARLTKISE